MIAHAKDIEFFVFRLSDVDFEKKEINALFWNKDKGGLRRKKTDYPEIVDSRVMKRNEREEYQSLYKHCLMSGVSLYDKQYTFDLINNSECSNYLINTHKYEAAELNNYLDKYNEIIIKPLGGNKGRGVCKLSRKDGLYVLSTHNSIEHLDENEYKTKYGDDFVSTETIVQPYLALSTNDDAPFDVRVNVHRGRNGRWTKIGKLIRVAKKGGLVSNIAGGGYLLARGVNRFYENEINADPKKINSCIDEIAAKVPDIIQRGFTNEIQTLGFDIGVNRINGEVKIIEVNGNPAIYHPIQLTTMLTKFKYYEYLHNNREPLMKKQLGLE